MNIHHIQKRDFKPIKLINKHLKTNNTRITLGLNFLEYENSNVKHIDSFNIICSVKLS